MNDPPYCVPTTSPVGISLENIPIGTVILVYTANSVYVLETKGDNRVIVSGGRHFPSPCEAKCRGIIWDRFHSIDGLIGPGYRLEFEKSPGNVVSTTMIVTVKVFQGEPLGNCETVF